MRKALELLQEVPLCDNCLGRMFALLGRGLTNAERGRALKLLISMELHRRIREGDESARELLRRLGGRLAPVASQLYRELFGEEPLEEPCYICGSTVAGGIESAAEEAVEKLRGLDVRRFLVAARIPPDMREREDEVKLQYGLQYAESIGSEVKREVSKRIQATLHLVPDFDTPEVIVEVDLSRWSTHVQRLPLLLYGRYWKLARRVSQSIWVTRRMTRRYPFSVEDAVAQLAEIYDGSDVVLHGAGREDADVRMLGTGRPFIAEVKEPSKRGVNPLTASIEVNRRSRGLVEVRLERMAKRGEVAAVKGGEGRHSKVYKALVVAERPLETEDLARLDEFFRERSVRQRTPRRVRHRRPDVVRERLVYTIRSRLLGQRVFESLIHAEGGLYIKELVSGDDGDTEPSFSSVLGTRTRCVELDVVAVLPPRQGRA